MFSAESPPERKSPGECQPQGHDFRFDPNGREYRYFLGELGLPSPSSLFKEFGMVDISHFKNHHRDRGHAVHAACHFWDDDDLEESTIGPAIAGYLKAWGRFRRETGFKPENSLSEKPMVSRLHNFGTTPDRCGTLNDSVAVIEIKSGGIHETTGRQLASHRIVLQENYGIIPVVSMAVGLKADGKYELKDFTETMAIDHDNFLALVSTHWQKRTGG